MKKKKMHATMTIIPDTNHISANTPNKSMKRCASSRLGYCAEEKTNPNEQKEKRKKKTTQQKKNKVNGLHFVGEK